MPCSKCEKKAKTEIVQLGGENIKIKKGALRRQLKLKPNKKFTIRELSRLEGITLGKSFTFQGNSFKMTRLLKSRITLGKNLMKQYKK